MFFSRQRNTLPEPYSGISLYTDLYQATTQAHNNLITITKIWRNNNIPYKWKFPTKLSIDRNNRNDLVSSLDEGLNLMKSWGLLPQEKDDISDPPSYGTPKEGK